jgi:hypothetical protein
MEMAPDGARGGQRGDVSGSDWPPHLAATYALEGPPDKE